MKNLFTAADTAETIDRINRLSADTQPQWGKMSVARCWPTVTWPTR